MSNQQSRIKQLARTTSVVALSVGGVAVLAKFMAPMGRGGLQCDGPCAPSGSEQIAALEQLLVWAFVGGVTILAGLVIIIAAGTVVGYMPRPEVENE